MRSPALLHYNAHLKALLSIWTQGSKVWESEHDAEFSYKNGLDPEKHVPLQHTSPRWPKSFKKHYVHAMDYGNLVRVLCSGITLGYHVLFLQACAISRIRYFVNVKSPLLHCSTGMFARPAACTIFE